MLGDGWRLPTDEEWKALIDQYGGYDDAYDDLIKGGSIGFAALLGGSRYRVGEYIFLGRYGYYWSATGVGAGYAWGYWFGGDGQRLSRGNYLKSYALSCRCIQDD